MNIKWERVLIYTLNIIMLWALPTPQSLICWFIITPIFFYIYDGSWRNVFPNTVAAIISISVFLLIYSYTGMILLAFLASTISIILTLILTKT